jgi:hypothetical protein
MMRLLLLAVCIFTITEANILDILKEKTKNIGKQTPVDVTIYAKNPSQICSLRITNVTNPYKQELIQSKLKPIVLDTGRYFREDISHLLKGAYEFEYKWEKEGKFIDSRLKTVHIFAYHDTRNRVHKKVNLTFLLRMPKICR